MAEQKRALEKIFSVTKDYCIKIGTGSDVDGDTWHLKSINQCNIQCMPFSLLSNSIYSRLRHLPRRNQSLKKISGKAKSEG